VKIQDVNIHSSPVVSVTTTTPTIDTFKLMDSAKKTALAVIDPDGKLIGSISAKDLKLFIESSCSYDVLKLPIMTFLQQIRSQQIDIRTPTVSCHLAETLALAIAKLAATEVHRLYIVDSSEDYTPVGVISLTDVLRYVNSQVH